MKSKKEFLILALLIIVLGAYLFVRQTDRIHYALPVMDTVDPTRITSVEITADASTLVVTRHDDMWHITPAQWPADSGMMQDILKVLEALKISDLVSEAHVYTRYDLDQEHGISVKAFEDETLIRDFTLGKTAPTYRHTFVRLSGDDNVYMAEGDFRRVFSITADELRSKLVLSFPRDEIARITITSRGTSMVLNREEIGDDGETSQAEQPKPRITWRNDQGDDVEESFVNDFLSPLSRLMCETYLNDVKPDELSNPHYTITLVGQEDYTLNIYASAEHKEFPAVSSQSAFVFLMPDYRMEQIEEFITKVQGKVQGISE
ncbi:MAG: DUF4340 domain-containing protein [Desulfomonilia bacterium]|nr:DUF4340 domain-containing protein [Desulfomonilia bacterium]